MTRLILIIALFFFLWLAIKPVHGQGLNQAPYIASCTEQDWLSIEDDGEGKAIVTYLNSIEECSSPVTLKLVSPNGIAVKVTIIIGDAETIILEPVDSNYMSFPPEADLKDGETKTFVIMGGMS